MHGKDTSGNILRGCLHLVDLAASGEDDTSLSCLEDVITSLSQKNYNIQQGSSKITSLLQDALGTIYVTSLIAFLRLEHVNLKSVILSQTYCNRLLAIFLTLQQNRRRKCKGSGVHTCYSRRR